MSSSIFYLRLFQKTYSKECKLLLVEYIENLVGAAVVLARHLLKLHIIWQKINIKIKLLEMRSIIGKKKKKKNNLQDQVLKKFSSHLWKFQVGIGSMHLHATRHQL